MKQSLLERLDTSSDPLCHEAAATIRQLHKEQREAVREFQREVREIAAEERWKATQGEDYGSY